MRIHSLPDRINPILLRELRQMVRNRLVLWIINLYLLAQVAMSWSLMQTILDPGWRAPLQFGTIVFAYFLGITTFASLIAVVGYTSLRIVVDRANEDLLFYTALSPGAIVRGRLVCGLVIGILFFSMSAPFLTFTYLLRGIDIRFYLFGIPLAFAAVQIVNVVALAVFSASRTYLQAAFYSLLFVAVAAGLFFAWWELWNEISIIISGSGAYRRHWFSRHHHYSGYWSYGDAFYIIWLVLFTVLWVPPTAYLFARCNLSPFAHNRMFPIRRWLSCWMIGTLIVCLVELYFHQWLNFGHRYGGGPPLFYWIAYVPYIIAAMLVMAVCERETWEGRLRRSIPSSLWRRIMVFPHYTGSVNGLFWCLLWTLFLIVFLSISEILSVHASNSYFGQNAGVLLWLFRQLIFLMLVFDYAMTAFFLWKVLFYRWMSREMIWTLACGLLALVSFGTLFVTYLIRETVVLSEIENGVLLAANPFIAMLDEGFEYHQAVCAIGWMSLIILFGYPWLRNRFLDFNNENTI